MNKWKLSFALVFVAGAVFLYLFIQNSLQISNSSLNTKQQTAFVKDLDISSLDNSLTGTRPSSYQDSSDYDQFEVEIITKLQTTYSDRIQELNVQASLIKVKQYVLNHYTTEGSKHFIRIIRAAFPRYAESIFSILDRLDIYSEWLIDNQAMLAELSHLEKNGALWEKRRELFGKDANIIWSDELAELAQKQTRIHDTIRQLDQSHDLSLDEKLYQLQALISENHEGSIQELSLNAGMLAQAFLNFDSVQQNLKQLSPEDRQLEINNVRRQLGFAEEQIENLQAKDEVRNQRWDNGLAYMNERNQLIDTIGEDELASALDALREQYFKADASTIKKEEESDFLRFNRPRKYGKN